MKTTSQPHRPIVSRVAAAVVLAVLGGVLVTAPALAADAELDTLDLGTGVNPRGVAFTPDGTRAFVASETAGSVLVIDTVTQQVIDTVAVAGATELAVSPDGSVVYVVQFNSGTVTVIDAESLVVQGGAIPVGNLPDQIEFSPDSTKAYVAGYGSASIVVIDVATAAVDVTVPGSVSPQGLAMSPDGDTLWIMQGGAKRIQPLDTATNTLGTGFIVDDPGDDEYLRYLDISPDGTTLAVGGDQTTKLYFVDIATEAIVGSVDVGDFSYVPMYTADGTRLYVGLGNGGAAVVNAATRTLIDTLGEASGMTNGLDIAPAGDFVYISNHDDRTISIIGEPVRRLTGTNRYETAIKVSQAGFPGGADVVFVATGTDYPDALAAGPAAAEMGGPVILTDNTTLFPAVKAEIERLDPEQIYVVGGPDRVSNAILAQLDAIAQTDRVTGTNRYETSRLIADLAFDTVPQVYIATGLNFPDALAAGAAGAVYGAPVILVNGTAPAVDQATLDLLVEFGNPITTVVGGTNMVSDGIKNQLSATRITGTNRYETALMINEAAYQGDSALRAILATGVIFPDALSASAWAGRIDAPLYLAPTSCVPAGVLEHMLELGVIQVTLVGGPDRLTQSVFDLTPC